jgi:hypothetical protein
VRVGFLVAGTQKGGTSALSSYLRRHPQICLANPKEVHLFDTEECFKWPLVVRERFYHSYFMPGISSRILGETTIYMYWYAAPRRIWEYNPRMKFILVLRNPIERAYSHWNMERDRQAESLSFFDAIKTERKRCREALPLQHRTYSYVDRGFYSDQIRRIWHFFPQEQTLFFKSEELRQNPRQVLHQIGQFLEIESFPPVEPKDVHSRPYISQLSAKERIYLAEIFASEIEELERMLGWDCGDWSRVSQGVESSHVTLPQE